MSEATVLLAAVQQGDSKAGAELLELVYDELRHLASARSSRISQIAVFRWHDQRGIASFGHFVVHFYS